MLGLGDEVRSHMDRISSRIGKHRDLGRPCFGVNADAPPEQPLRRDDVDIAWSGDQVDLATQAGHTVGEHRDRLRPADRIDLIDSEDVAEREDIGVRQAAELDLRRRGERDRRVRRRPSPGRHS